MSNGEWTNDPEIFCPVCGETFRYSDAWECALSTVVECPHCEADIQCRDTDTRRTWIWEEFIPKKPAASGGAE